MATNPIVMEDIQGLILRGYNFHYIRYIILTIKDKAGAQQFCADLASESNLGGLHVTSAKPWPLGIKPDYCLNIGFTYAGLEQLIGEKYCDVVDDSCSQEVFQAYKLGSVGDAPQIGDVGQNAPGRWWQNGGWISKPGPDYDGGPKPDGSDLHIQITLFTLLEENREKYYDQLLGMIPKIASGPSVVPVFFQDSDPIIINNDPEYIHFGYRDSLSQPKIADVIWNDPNVKLLMGMPESEDDRPEVPADRFVISQNAKDYNAHPLLTNGTFAAFRLLYQDEAKFNAFIASDGPDNVELMAAKMCGRWRDGTPLTVSPNGEDKKLGIPASDNYNFTNFNYNQATVHQQGVITPDMEGLRCPYAAHIRRANPRDDTSVKGNFNNAVTHRILRRASPYGPIYDPKEEGEVQRGLVGLFINAMLDTQFRFITNLWFNQGGFRDPDESGNQSGIDPLFGPQVKGKNPSQNTVFEFNDNGTYKVFPGLTPFVRTDGSMYLFLPSITGLKHLSQGTIPEPTTIS